MIRKLIFSLLLLTASPLAAQKSGTTISDQPVPTGQYVANTVVFKLKPDMRNSIAENIPTHQGLLKLFKDIKLSSLQKMIPAASMPQGRKGVLGKDYVDLSTIYILTYGGDKSVEEVVRLLKKTGLVEYAEPEYIEKLFFIPNDPEAQPGSGKETVLQMVRAYEAWDIEKGDTNVYIGIIDTDLEVDNPDLKNKIKKNYNDPVNGLDDDGDLYVDNFMGWDLANNDNDVRAKKALVSKITKSSTGIDSSYVDTLNGNGHATMVAGCAAAETNNGIGVAGTGFNTKILPIKAMADSSAATGGILKGYPGVVYAADHGCKVINLSWGGGNNYSSYNQDLINYAALNYDVVIVAAAGNDGIEEDFYPASYDNVLSVAGSQIQFSPTRNKNIDVKATFASYGYHVDLCAPGKDIYTTWKTGYNTGSGSSFSSPYVAGAAALVRSKFPTWKAMQVQEQLRITADVIDTLPENKTYKEKLGKGRLNMYRALTDTLMPSIRMLSSNLPDNVTKLAFSGDTIRLTCQFFNYLHATTALKIHLSSPSPYLKFLDSTINIGAVASLTGFSNQNHPFVFVLKQSIPPDYMLVLRLGYDDGTYQDYQYFHGAINPSFIVIDTNQVALTVTSSGRLGFNDGSHNLEGIGFVYKNLNLLFEGGLMVSNGPAKVSDCVRGIPAGDTDLDFATNSSVHYVPSLIASEETFSQISDTIPDKIGVEIIQHSYAWHTPPSDKFVMLSYQIKNISGNTIDTLHAGIFADWDIMDETKNKAAWDSATSLGYVFSTDANGLYGGIRVLSGQTVSCYSMDHSSTIGGNNIYPNDGFSTMEKYLTLSKGVFRPTAGNFSTAGGDVSQVVGASVYHIQNNESRTITFAILAGDNKADLINSATEAENLYKKYSTVTTADINEGTQDGVTLFPNPFAGKLEIKSANKEEITSVAVLNMYGAEILTASKAAATEYSIDLPEQPSGMYIVKIRMGNKIYTRKITKQ
jgi:serine protease